MEVFFGSVSQQQRIVLTLRDLTEEEGEIEEEKSADLKVSWHFPLVLLVKEDWKKGKAFGSE